MDADSAEATKAVRKALGRVVTEGLVPDWVAEVGWQLLKLEVVRNRVEVGQDASESERDSAYTKALTSVLSEAVESYRIGGKSRRILRCVLPLDSQYLGMSVKERRTEAGKVLKPGRKVVKPGTIRTYYEPKALDKLAEVLVEMERAFREQKAPSAQ